HVFLPRQSRSCKSDVCAGRRAGRDAAPSTPKMEVPMDPEGFRMAHGQTSRDGVSFLQGFCRTNLGPTHVSFCWQPFLTSSSHLLPKRSKMRSVRDANIFALPGLS